MILSVSVIKRIQKSVFRSNLSFFQLLAWKFDWKFNSHISHIIALGWWKAIGLRYLIIHNQAKRKKISGVTAGRYSASRALVCSESTWGRVRPIGFVANYASQSMRSPPELPDLAPSMHLLLGEAATGLPQGTELMCTHILPVFRERERSILEDEETRSRLARLEADHHILPNTSAHRRARA